MDGRASAAASAGSAPSWRITERMIQMASARAANNAMPAEIHIAALIAVTAALASALDSLVNSPWSLIRSSTVAK